MSSSDVAVIVGTFGDQALWADQALRALESVEDQTIPPADIIWNHAETLQEARNGGVGLTDARWLILLDADDKLAPHYIEAMLYGDGDIRQPSVRVGSDEPLLTPPCDLKVGNYLVIGSMVRHDLFDTVGGFDDLPILEDWDFWQKCWLAGADIGACPDAVYLIGSRENSRNSDQELHNRVYCQIRERYAHRVRGQL